MTSPSPSSPASLVAFVAGATGYTGSALVPLLVEQGWTVYAHVRPDSSSLERWRATFDAAGAHTDTTPWDEAALRARFAEIQPTHVFALLGTTKARAKGHSGAIADTYESVDYGLSAMLRRAAEESAPTARYVYLSSLGVSPRSSNPYIMARAKLEAELRAGTLAHVIIRPALITGDDRDESRPGERAAAMLLAGAIGLVGLVGAKRAHGAWRTRDAKTLAAGIAAAATQAPSGSELSGADLDALSV